MAHGSEDSRSSVLQRHGKRRAPLHAAHPTLLLNLSDFRGSECLDARGTTHHTVTFEDGYFAIPLGTITPLDLTDFQHELTIVVEVDGTELMTQAIASVPHALSVHGVVQVSDALQCESGDEGTLRWASGTLKVCDGVDWLDVGSSSGGNDGATQATAAQSCKQLHIDHPSLPSAAYWIDPDGGPTTDAYHLWCDMIRDDGGWTLVAANQNGTSGVMPMLDDGQNEGLLDDGAEPVGLAKIADADIDLLGREFRHTVESYGTYNRYYLLTHALIFDQPGQITASDKCKTSYGAAYQTPTAVPVSNIKGLTSSANGSGNSDICGGGSEASWWSYIPNGTSEASYRRVGASSAYHNGWVYVR